jgi:hypothetical protein
MTEALSAHNGVLHVETCGGTWLLDARRRKFCRVERGTPVTFVPPRAWHPFHSLHIGETGLVRLVLDERAVSALSAWLHADGCPRCAQALLKPA